MPNYEENSEAANIADELIQLYHQRLTGVPIMHLLNIKLPPKPSKNKKPKKPAREGAKVVIAKISKVSQKTRVISGKDYFFEVTYNSIIWDAMSPWQKRVVVDHELCHAGNDADGTYIIPHGIEDFPAIIERYGFWKSDVDTFARAVLEVYNNGASDAAPPEDNEIKVEGATTV